MSVRKTLPFFAIGSATSPKSKAHCLGGWAGVKSPLAGAERIESKNVMFISEIITA